MAQGGVGLGLDYQPVGTTVTGDAAAGLRRRPPTEETAAALRAS
jgi:hypothetical protein